MKGTAHELGEEDVAARRAALDPARSFIVQAPAGSGKTALLIQRFLALLARVQRPEAVLAMTFTRKAAAEMQSRIVAALRAAAADDTTREPSHEAETMALAKAVLAQDVALGWNLVEHPARLRVQTIDAFCASLMQQAPLRSGFGSLPRFVDDARPIYRSAALAALRHAAGDNPAWRRLLAHLDNDADRTVDLLASILGRREQWLRHLVQADPDALRASLEQVLEQEIADELSRIGAIFDPGDWRDLAEHLRYAAAHLSDDALPPDLADHAVRGDMPSGAAGALPLWRWLAHWLLHADKPTFRMKMTSAHGFPPKSGAKGHEERARRHERNEGMRSLLARFGATPGLAQALHNARRLPPPAYDDAQWAFVAALLEVLPELAAHLRLVFAETGSIDFTEATLCANHALGAADAPSDLLLTLDMRLEHILVDEFQDTSYAQFELMERLTAGWMPGDGRTLFIVGDPMQSIYRFREAEVGLFLRAARQGIGDIALTHLRLRRNFRSQARLVEWVNAAFARVFPPRDDASRGAIAFSESVATRAEAQTPNAVTVQVFATPSEEAREVAKLIHAARRHLPAGTIAVLVRARTHLEALLPVLSAEAIAFDALELDALSDRQTVLDLVSLTHALSQPVDRLAWMACLRAPWCGLTLADLLVVAASEGRPVWDVIHDDAALKGVSADGASRLARFRSALEPLVSARGRIALSSLVRGAWLGLGGPACGKAEDVDVADCFFHALEAHAPGADCTDWSVFMHAIANLRLALPCGEATRVQVMTLHRAKGLEFDTVIIPALARRSGQRKSEILRWRDRPPRGLLLAPLKARNSPRASVDPVYGYIDALIADEEDAELSRLLYVGATRARERLHLLAALEPRAGDARGPLRWAKPSAGSALAKLWDALGGGVSPPGAETTIVGAASGRASGGVPLVRLRVGWHPPPPPPPILRHTRHAVAPLGETIAFDWARETARHIGTVAHRALRDIGEQGLQHWGEARLRAESERVQRELAGLGVVAPELANAREIVLEALRKTLGDPRGRWLFAPDHTNPRSELALTGYVDDALFNVVIDRSFVDRDGVRWIVDFKLSTHEGGDREGFVERERERYRSQLASYAALLGAMESRPTHLALYFPRLGAWREWLPGT